MREPTLNLDPVQRARWWMYRSTTSLQPVDVARVMSKGECITHNEVVLALLAPVSTDYVTPRLSTTVARQSPRMPAQEITLACTFTTSIMNTGISINGYISLT
jgi:hypothetical protein